MVLTKRRGKINLAHQSAAAVITGGGSGIGAATAVELAAKGARVALVDRNEDGLKVVADKIGRLGGQVSIHPVDITDAAAVAALPGKVRAEHGGSHILVNCAGVSILGSFEQVTLEEFKWLLDINLWGTIAVTKAFLPDLLEQRAAHISNLSSGYGLIAPGGRVPYATSKFGVRGFTEAISHELESSSISVSVVHPGGIKTEIALKARVAAAVPAAVGAKAAQAQTAKYRTTPEDAGAAIVRGIERRSPRVLIGNDAKLLDGLARAMPVRSWSLLRSALSGAIST